MIIREEYPRLFDALAMLCEQGTDRAKQVNSFLAMSYDDKVMNFVLVFLSGHCNALCG